MAPRELLCASSNVSFVAKQLSYRFLEFILNACKTQNYIAPTTKILLKFMDIAAADLLYCYILRLFASRSN